jgi:hypothetical protein
MFPLRCHERTIHQPRGERQEDNDPRHALKHFLFYIAYQAKAPLISASMLMWSNFPPSLYDIGSRLKSFCPDHGDGCIISIVHDEYLFDSEF